VREGGRIETGPDGREAFVIPVRAPRPSPLELSWAPGPAAGSRFTAEEMDRIVATPGKRLQADLERFAPGWTIADCGPDMSPGFHAEALGRTGVFVTHPLSRETPCVLRTRAAVPANGSTALILTAGRHEKGDWELVVRVNGAEADRRTIGPRTAPDGWADVRVDLTGFAGQTVDLEVANRANGWAWEGAYWGRIEIETKN